MAMTIWKAVLTPENLLGLEVPEGSEFIHAREQRDEICVWYRCDPSKRVEKRKLSVIGTGGLAPPDARYIGAASINGGSYIFHVFEGR